MLKNHETGEFTHDFDCDRLGGGGPTYELVGRGDFILGQCYDNDPAATAICRGCGGDRWIVGQGSHLTLIKCPQCGREILVHDG